MPEYPLENIFTYHAPFGTQQGRYTDLRRGAKDLAKTILDHCPDSRERSLALTNLEQAIFWANAAIARNEKPASAQAEDLIRERQRLQKGGAA